MKTNVPGISVTGHLETSQVTHIERNEREEGGGNSEAKCTMLSGHSFIQKGHISSDWATPIANCNRLD